MTTIISLVSQSISGRSAYHSQTRASKNKGKGGEKQVGRRAIKQAKKYIAYMCKVNAENRAEPK